MTKFKKRPVVIEAVQFDFSADEWPVGVESPAEGEKGTLYGYIQTLEGRMIVSDGDWVITGVNGEKYPCKPDIFEKTYEAVEKEGQDSIKQSISVEDAINLLNELLVLDNNAVGALVANRVPCNEGIAEHYSVQVEKRNGGFNVGLLGILNGLFGVDGDVWGAITSEFDCGNIIRFRRTSSNDKN